MSDIEQSPEAVLVAPSEGASKWLRPRFITGAAGTGKSSQLLTRIALGEEGIRMSATTGVAATNLGPGISTVHSLLGFSDEQKIKDNWVNGRLTSNFERLMKAGVKELAIDELSLLSGDMLDCLYKAAEEASERRSYSDDPDNPWEPFRLTLLGDFLQLPVIDSNKWACDAQCWPQFMAEGNFTRLTKIHRQSDPTFLAAMTAARRGDGGEAAELLIKAGVEFSATLDDSYPGATLFGANDKMNRYNDLRLQQTPGQLFGAKSTRWLADGASAPSEWKHIPEVLKLKLGALVMLKANDLPGFRYANGDLGVLESWDKETGQWNIKLRRTGEVVQIGRVTRAVTQKELPPWMKEVAPNAAYGREHKQPFWDKDRYVLGEVQYFPLKVAYAITTHSSQALSLDAVQIDVREGFMGTPAISYVALSRARTPEGLRIVGTPEKLAKRIRVHEKAKGWI